MAYTTVTPTVLVTPEPSNSSNVIAETSVTPGAGNGVKFANGGRVMVIVRNTDAAVASANIATQGTFHGLAIADIGTVGTGSGAAVAGSGGTSPITVLGPFDPAVYNDASGNMQIEFTGAGAASSLKVTVIQMP